MSRVPVWMGRKAEDLAEAVMWVSGVAEKISDPKVFQEVLELVYDELEGAYFRGYHAGEIGT